MFTFTYGLDNERFSMEYKVNDTLKYTRYYFDTYEKEVKADGTVRHLNYIYAPNGLIAIYDQKPAGDSLYYVYTDYLGSLRCITDSSGVVKQRLSYDAWGNRRDSITGERDSTIASSLLFARGFTGHEHLDEVGLINMNGRVYDPMLGMFISPDNFIQAPDFSQNYNRYSYCLNNPLSYTDPTGYTWWSHFWGWAGETTQSVATAGLKINSLTRTIVPSSLDALFNWDASRLDPFNKGTISNNNYRINKGLFAGSSKQILSRFTWELPQTALGYGYSQGANYFGTVKSVNYYDGATVVQNYKDHVWLGPGSGVTLGSFINGSNQIKAIPNNWLFQHEYGHYLQSQYSGWAYLPRFAVPSIFSKGDHDYNPIEQDANARAIQYFYNRVGSNLRWHFDDNPIGYPGTGWSMTDYDTPEFQSLLKSLTINASPLDYLSWGGGIIGVFVEGASNAHFYNQRYIDYENVIFGHIPNR